MTKSFDMRAVFLTIFMMLSATIFAQVTVTGVVTESSGEPVIGATIREKGNQTNGTVIDIDGNYSIKVTDPLLFYTEVIPRNATGKIEKPKLRKMHGADQLVGK